VTPLRPELQHVVDGLIELSAARREVTLDEIGDALGILPASHDEIDTMLAVLEAAGRKVVGPEGGGGEATLRRVLDEARAIRLATGRSPGAPELAARLGLPLERVRHALALARVIAR
jgi:hypothetical protein